MPQQALELRIQALVVANAVQVVALRHPFDVEYDQSHAQRMMRENRARYRLRRPDGLAWRRKSFLELSCELFEQLDVLGFLAGEPQKRSRPIVVFVQMGPRVVHHEGQN